MQNKKLTYILLALAVVLWGFIILKIFDYLKPSDDSNQDIYFSSNKDTLTNTIDTFSINPNYRDPFLNTYPFNTHKSNNNIEKANDKIIQTVLYTKQQEVVWPEIKYKGIIKSISGDKSVIIIQVDNKNYIITNNMIVDGIKMEKAFKDSVLLSYMSQKRFYYLKNRK